VDAVATTPNGDMTSVLVIKQVDGALKAEMGSTGPCGRSPTRSWKATSSA
jgi:hypothetical protein